MADENLLLLNQMYGIATVPTQNNNQDSKNKQTIELNQQTFQLTIEDSTEKKHILYQDYQNTAQEDDKVVTQSSNLRFAGYINEDYLVEQLEKKSGNYWITKESKKFIFYTGVEFLVLGNYSDGNVESRTKIYNFQNTGTIEKPIVNYPNGITYHTILNDINNHFIIQIIIDKQIYNIGNINENSIEFSFDDETYYKQLRLFENNIEVMIQSHNNFFIVE